MSKRVFITGAARGIGESIAAQYRRAGYDVIAPIRAECDLASLDSVTEYLSRQGALDVDTVVNNAAENTIFPIEKLPFDAWQRMLMVNLTSPLLITKHAAPQMIARGGGRIVNISSVYSVLSRIGRAAYSASKAGLNALTRTAALEYANHNILVNSVCPGFVDTDLTRANNSAAQIESLCRQVPLGRLAQPEEIAELVFFLGSEQNTYITGQTILIDGGFTIQ